MAPKRHHYVPRFLLKRFSGEPGAKNPAIWRLDKASGQAARSSIVNEAVISHFNRVEAASGLTADSVETLLATIEGMASPLVTKLVRGQAPAPEERLNLALFVWLQQQRTPLGRAWQVFMQEQTARLQAMKNLLDAESVRAVFEGRDEFKTPDEIEAWRRQTIQELDDGTLFFRATHDHEVLGMFLLADRLAPTIASRMAWVGLRAPKGKPFILSDHPLAIHDPEAGPEEPTAWLSSPTVEVTLPLDPSFCLLLTPGPAIYRTVQASEAVVQEVNLRTYAWGHWAVYGPSLTVVQRVRAAAERNAQMVAAFAPRAPRLFIGERIEGQPAPHSVTMLQPAARGSRSRHQA